MKRKCSVCDCFECPNSIACKRKQSQPTSHFIFRCAKCECQGVTDLRGKTDQVLEIERKPDGAESQRLSSSANEKKEQQMSLPAPQENENSKEKSPILKVSHVKKGATITLLGTGREVSGNYGDQLCLDVKLGAKDFAWFVKMDSANYRMLYKRFGKNLVKWKGKVKVEKDHYLGNDYIKVVE